jgi:uncharacterized metal-binding protein
MTIATIAAPAASARRAMRAVCLEKCPQECPKTGVHKTEANVNTIWLK